MSTKTIALTGSEIMAEFSGANAWLRNDGTDVIYAAAKPGITAGADGVVAIPAGQSAPVYGANGMVWLLGTGSVQLIGSDYSTNPFKTSAQSGGSGADDVARAAISAHSGNAEIHVTADEKAAWNAINYSNPNILDNPDYRINQRGQSEYTAAGYTVDRWTANTGSVTVNANGIVLTNNSSTAMRFRQYLEIDFSRIAGKNLTLSVCIDGTIYTGSGIVPYEKPAGITQIIQIAISDNIAANLTFSPSKDAFDLYLYVGIGASSAISWVKLELGGTATPFVPPDTALELTKCQRYYQIRSTNDIDPVDLRPSMRATPTDIKQVTGGYAYVAEL